MSKPQTATRPRIIVLPVDEATQQVLRQEFLTALAGYVGGSWAFARAVARVVQTGAWKWWGHPSQTAWAIAELKGIATPSAVSRLAAAVGAVDTLNPELRRQAEALPVWNVVEALGVGDPAEAVALATAAPSQGAIRKAVAERRPELHQETEYRSIMLRVPEPVHRQWLEAVNIVRWRADERDPGDATVVVAMAQAVLQEPHEPQARFSETEIRAGAARCKLCGSWRASDLERHHVVPRSHGGHEGPTVPLCHDCHRGITENRDGKGWRHYARLWGFDDA